MHEPHLVGLMHRLGLARFLANFGDYSKFLGVLAEASKITGPELQDGVFVL